MAGIGPLQFIREMVSAGKSATAGLAEFRQAGGSIRTQRWYAAFGELQHELNTRPRVVEAPLNRRPVAEEITRVTSSRPNAFNYRHGVIVYNNETGMRETMPVIVRSKTLITYGEAQQQAMQTILDTGYDLQVVGAFTTAVSQLVPLQ